MLLLLTQMQYTVCFYITRKYRELRRPPPKERRWHQRGAAVADSVVDTVNHLGRKDDFTLSVFYDFQQVPFFVSAEDKSVLTYRFELDNAQEIKIPIRLDLADSGHPPDEYLYSHCGLRSRASNVMELQQYLFIMDLYHA